MIKILSRNVNGVRAIWNKGFCDIINKLKPNVICLQETKAFAHQLNSQMHDLGWEYQLLWHSGTRPWYAGTCIYTLGCSDHAIHTFEDPLLHDDGRTTQVSYHGLTIVNCYFPNGCTRSNGTEMLSYKMNFYDHMSHHLDQQWQNTIIVGDFNIAHTPIDIARPAENEYTIWFTIWERHRLTQFLDHGRVDVFRHLYPDHIQYTRRSVRSWARPRNIWRRIDYACIRPSLLPRIKYFAHHTDIMGSDHCPIELRID